MSFDSVIIPAFSIASTPGAYAILVGAGVSKSSGVPSAWDVQVELIQRAALVLEKEEVSAAAVEDWWRSWAGAEPTYTAVLEKIAPLAHERQALLREMFEPSESEQEEGKKGPTPAHRAIAELVRSGHVRVIVTTNFDLLTERAIRDLGIEPYVVSDAAAARGLPPLHTLPALVLHLHGDYFNPSTMLNTVAELEAYDPDVAGLLGEVLRSHGLIIAGWSAVWDTALRSAIQSEARRFYTPLWIEPFELGEVGNQLATNVAANVISEQADVALPILAEAVASIVQRRARHPLVAGTEVEAAKRALSARFSLVPLHDLLRWEFDRLRAMPELDLSEHPRDQSTKPVAEIKSVVGEAALVPTSLIATVAYWGDSETDSLWIDELERFSRQARGGGLTELLTLRRVAGRRFFYAAGVAAVASSRHDLVLDLLSRRITSDNEAGDVSLAWRLRSAASVEIFLELKKTFEQDLVLGAELYEESWERFEYLWMIADLVGTSGFEDLVAREGAVHDTERARLISELSRPQDARGRHLRAQDHMPTWISLTGRKLQTELNSLGERHPLVAAGWGSSARLMLASQVIEQAIGQQAERVSWGLGGGWIPSLVWIDGSPLGKWPGVQ